MKLLYLKISLIIIGLIIVNNGCERRAPNKCIKGMFIGYYCEGCVIKILDNSNIGKSWSGMYDSKLYENSVVASVDSIYIKTVPGVNQYFTSGSIFYFKYIDGGYPRKEFNICNPSPFITITSLSISPCP
jgi:hypothetical protein